MRNIYFNFEQGFEEGVFYAHVSCSSYILIWPVSYPYIGVGSYVWWGRHPGLDSFLNERTEYHKLMVGDLTLC